MSNRDSAPGQRTTAANERVYTTSNGRRVVDGGDQRNHRQTHERNSLKDTERTRLEVSHKLQPIAIGQ